MKQPRILEEVMTLFWSICRKNQKKKKNAAFLWDLGSRLNIKGGDLFSVFHQCVDKRKQETKSLQLEMPFERFGFCCSVTHLGWPLQSCWDQTICVTMFAGLDPNVVKPRRWWISTQMRSAFGQKEAESTETGVAAVIWGQILALS